MKLFTNRLVIGCILSAFVLSACDPSPTTQSIEPPVPVDISTPKPVQPIVTIKNNPFEIIVYAADLPDIALYELLWADDREAAGGRLLTLRNLGDELDAPPENDPHVTFKVAVQAGIPYRCWVHMKVGAPKGMSTANVLWVQFTGAVDKAGKATLQPQTDSFLTAQGLEQTGWAWVGCDRAGGSAAESLISFQQSGEATVRIQAGMEGVGFDQIILSSAQFLEKPPAEAIVKK